MAQALSRPFAAACAGGTFLSDEKGPRCVASRSAVVCALWCHITRCWPRVRSRRCGFWAGADRTVSATSAATARARKRCTRRHPLSSPYPLSPPSRLTLYPHPLSPTLSPHLLFPNPLSPTLSPHPVSPTLSPRPLSSHPLSSSSLLTLYPLTLYPHPLSSSSLLSPSTPTLYTHPEGSPVPSKVWWPRRSSFSPPAR